MTGRDRDIWLKTGHCFTCPDKTYPGPNKHECIFDPCDEERDFLKNDGTCHTCPEYTYPVKETMECRNDTCDTSEFTRQYPLPNGRCFTCDEGEYGWKNSSGSGCALVPPRYTTCPPPEYGETYLETHYFVPVGTNPDLLGWGKDIDGTCIFCEAPWKFYDAESMTCKPVPNYPGTMTTPEYSYVYKYTNKTTPGNITYPDYDIETTKWTGGDNYTVQEENTCPCDLSEFETGTKKLNEILKIAVDSAVEQQAKADYEFYDPLLVDPDSVPVIGEPDLDFYEE
jgi:hypothetical protein